MLFRMSLGESFFPVVIVASDDEGQCYLSLHRCGTF